MWFAAPEKAFPRSGGRTETHALASVARDCRQSSFQGYETSRERGVSFRILEVLSEGLASVPGGRGQVLRWQSLD
jgi:hypothetical protein